MAIAPEPPELVDITSAATGASHVYARPKAATLSKALAEALKGNPGPAPTFHRVVNGVEQWSFDGINWGEPAQPFIPELDGDEPVIVEKPA